MLYCGLDLHAKESFFYVLDESGHRVVMRKIATRAQTFKQLVRPLVPQGLKVVLEASTMTRWAVEQLRKVGAEEIPAGFA